MRNQRGGSMSYFKMLAVAGLIIAVLIVVSLRSSDTTQTPARFEDEYNVHAFPDDDDEDAVCTFANTICYVKT